MATWNVQSNDGLRFIIEAPDDVTAQEVNEFAAENADSWVNGGRYRMAPVAATVPVVGNLRRQSALPGAVSFTDEEQALIDAVETSPGKLAQLDAEIDRTKDPKILDILHAERAKFPVMEPAGSEPAEPEGRTNLVKEPKPEAPQQPAPALSHNEEVAEVVKLIDARMASLLAQLQDLTSRQFRMPMSASVSQRAQLQDEYDALKAQRAQFTVGDSGQTVGGISGALAGAGTGIALGSFAGPPGMAIGGLLGSILGGAAGVAAGTHLWDIPAAQEAIDISDEEAAALIQSRVIESLVWDGVFTLILGPGGRVLGKMVNGSKWLPAFKASAKESVAWDQIAKSKTAQMDKVVGQRAADAPKGLATRASDALQVPKGVSDAEASRELVQGIADRSGGHIPTQGEMRGLVQGSEGFARRQSPMPFFKNDQVLADTAEAIRQTALRDLDAAGAYQNTQFGEAIRTVVDSANRTLKREAGPVFERAAQQNVFTDMQGVLKYVDDILKKDAAAANRLLTGSERESLTVTRDALKKSPMMTAEAAQDFISGNKSALRGVTGDGTKPGEFMGKVLGEMNALADGSYVAALRSVDPVLARDLLGVRKLYKDTFGDLYSDTMVTLARKNPEDMGRALTTKGTVTEIRELRAALDRAVSGAPVKARIKGGAQPKLSELSKDMLGNERKRIDAGLIKGFIEKNTQSLADLDTRLRDPEFRQTLKELLVGQGVADPVLGKKVLNELDRVLGVVKLIKPEMAPQPGRLPVPGMGGFGVATAASAATGQRLGPGTIATVLGTISGVRLMGRMMATAMTTGNMGALRTLQRAAALAPAAGKNAAAAETLAGLLRELDGWDRENGGEGFPEMQQGLPEPQESNPEMPQLKGRRDIQGVRG